jgi:hypothetical protein
MKHLPKIPNPSKSKTTDQNTYLACVFKAGGESIHRPFAFWRKNYLCPPKRLRDW